MLIAGLTGGMACGKSFVADALRELGCYIVEADALGHEAMLPGAPAHRQILYEFGAAMANAGGQIDRSMLAAVVFADPAALARLNAIVHPAVHALAQRRFREIGGQDPHAIVIYVAAILIETGGYRQFPKLIVVACTREQQIARAMARAGINEAAVLARLEHQLPIEKKKEYADYVIDSGGTLDDTLRQTKMVFEELRKLAS